MMSVEGKVKVAVGDLVIVVLPHGAAPLQAKVTRVSPKGWIGVDGQGATKFRPKRGPEGEWQQAGENHWRYITHVYLYSEAKWHEVVDAYAKAQEYAKREQEQKDKRQAEREEQREQEIRQLKDLLQGDFRTIRKSWEILPDGSRFGVFALPTKPEYQEWRGKEQRVILRLVNVEEIDWQASRAAGQEEIVKVPRVNARLATVAASGREEGFSSWSGATHASDEEAIWESLRCAYYSW